MPLSHADLKSLRALSQKKHRLSSRKIVIEGFRLVQAALTSDAQVERLLCTRRFMQGDEWPRLQPLITRRSLTPEEVSATQAEQLSNTRTPQGVYVVLHWPQQPTLPHLDPPILILDAIADPGNLGTLLRTADWFGMPTVLVSADSADITNPKVMRGGMGAHFHLPRLYQGELDSQLATMKAKGTIIIGATLDGEALSAVQSPSDWALVLGSEAHGLSPFWHEALDLEVTVPSAGAAESLNVAVAGGIILNHLLQPAP